jgi:hypothetical protein
LEFSGKMRTSQLRYLIVTVDYGWYVERRDVKEQERWWSRVNEGEGAFLDCAECPSKSVDGKRVELKGERRKRRDEEGSGHTGRPSRPQDIGLNFP